MLNKFEEARKPPPAGVGDFLKTAKHLKRDNRVDGAISILHEGVEKYPRSFDLWTVLGNRYQETETRLSQERALYAYERAHLLFPANKAGVLTYAAQLGNTSKYDIERWTKSEDTLLRFMSANGLDMDALVVLGDQYKVWGERKLAMACYHKALDFEQKTGNVLERCADLQKNGVEMSGAGWAVVENTMKRAADRRFMAVVPRFPQP